MEEVLSEWVKVFESVEMGIDHHREVGYSGERKANEETYRVYLWEDAWSLFADKLSDIEVDRAEFTEHYGLGHRNQVSTFDHGGRKSACRNYMMDNQLLGLRRPISSNKQHDDEVTCKISEGEHSCVGNEWLISEEAIAITSELTCHFVAKIGYINNSNDNLGNVMNHPCQQLNNIQSLLFGVFLRVKLGRDFLKNLINHKVKDYKEDHGKQERCLMLPRSFRLYFEYFSHVIIFTRQFLVRHNFHLSFIKVFVK